MTGDQEIDAGALDDIDGAGVLEFDGRAALIRIDGDLGDVLSKIARLGLDAIDYNQPNLEDMYRLLYLEAGDSAESDPGDAPSIGSEARS